MRKEPFLKKKSELSTTMNSSSDVKFDLCDYGTNTKHGLKMHIERAHKNIPQIDGIPEKLEEEQGTQTDESTEEVTTLNIVGDGKDFIEVKLKPPKFVEDPELGTGTLSSVDMETNIICYRFKSKDTKGKEFHFEEESLAFKIIPPQITTVFE